MTDILAAAKAHIASLPPHLQHRYSADLIRGLAAEVERLRLTAEEREAIEGAMWDYGQYADEMGLSVAEVTERQDTLRSLLERLAHES